MTGPAAGDPPPGEDGRVGDPGPEPGATTLISGATPQGIRWLLMCGQAWSRDLNGTGSIVGEQGRSRRRALIAEVLGPPTPLWQCPDCGSSKHGRPTWGGGSISTSDLQQRDGGEEWLALAVGPREFDIGIDLVTADLSPIAGRTMSRFFTRGELRLADQVGVARMWARKESLAKSRGTGLLGQRLAGVSGGPLDTLALDVRIADLDLGPELSRRLLASVAWVPASLERTALQGSAT